MSREAAIPTRVQPSRSKAESWLQWGVTAPTLLLVALVAEREAATFLQPRLLIWLAFIVLVDLFPIPTSGGASYTVDDPLLIAFALLYSPELVFLMTFLASVDVRELRRSIPLRAALYTRSQMALSCATASLVGRHVGTVTSNWPLLLLAVLTVASVYYSLNLSAVALLLKARQGIAFRPGIRGLLLDAPLRSILGYVSFALLGMVIARLYVLLPNPEWVVGSAAICLLVLARSTFLHIRSIQREADLLRQREAALEAVSDRVAQERRDERMQLAESLHDEAIPALEAINLLANVGTASLAAGDATGAVSALADLRAASSRESELLRSIVGQLRRAEIGPRGLDGAISDVAEALQRNSQMVIHLDVSDLDLPRSVELLLFQIAREAMSNAVAHSRGQNVWVSLSTTAAGEAQLTIRDDGCGFDPGAVPEDHFGVQLMRERATALGTELTVATSGEGTRVRMVLPPHWLAPFEPTKVT
jgi:signal transduction histidine kinase